MYTTRFSWLFITLMLFSSQTHSIECATSKCYIDAYNSIDSSSSPFLSRVQRIHQRLVRVIGSQQAKRSRLYVIDSVGYPWAVALTDNAIVLTKGSIDAMYQENDTVLGDARAAFVIGHELSHLATEDLFHHKSFVFNQTPAQSIQPAPGPKPEDELRADLRGYTFATLAGYQTDLLLGGDDDFFKSWLSQITNTNLSSTHPNNDIRSRYTQQGFKKILDDVPYFWFSIALSHFGRYTDARYLLEDHLNNVETEQAYATLGYTHLQLARKHMPVSIAYRYWIPTLLEPDSGLELQRNRNLFDQEIPEKALQHLKLAEQILLHAISMDESNLSSHINLAAVYLYMPDKLHKAYASIEEARRTPLGQLPEVREQLESIYQLIRIKDDLDGGDRWPKARDTLIEMAKSPSPPDNLLFNLARMLDQRGRDDTAKKYWNTLLDRADSLPPVYKAQVCFRLNVECADKPIDSPWETEDLPFGKDIRYPEVKGYLARNWNSDPIPEKDLPNLNAKVFTNSSGDSLLALDNHLEMAIVRNIPSKYRKFTDLQRAFGDPYVFLPIPDGQLLSYSGGWSALIKDGIVAEIWISKLK